MHGIEAVRNRSVYDFLVDLYARTVVVFLAMSNTRNDFWISKYYQCVPITFLQRINSTNFKVGGLQLMETLSDTL